MVRQPKAGSMFSWPCVPGELKVMWQMAGRERGIGLRARARQIHQTVFPEMQRDPAWDEQEFAHIARICNSLCSFFLPCCIIPKSVQASEGIWDRHRTRVPDCVTFTSRAAC